MLESETAEQQEKPLDLSEIRWKMLVACDICRRRKVRCDGQRPCLRCSKDSKECTFSTPKRLVVHPENQKPLKRQRPSSPLADHLSPKQSVSNLPSPEVVSPPGASRGSAVTGKLKLDQPQSSSKSTKEHLLLIDSDDQIVYSGPSTGMPLFARLGLLHTVEVSESDKNAASFVSHTAGALGITSASTSAGDFFNICLQHCPQELMFNLIGYHLKTPVFFPLLHAPSFLAEFVAVTQRRIICTPQYGALLMSILAVTARLVESAKALLPAAERDQAGENYYEVAQDFLRISKNKLDIRHILALYHLALFSEGRNSSTSSVSSFVSEAVGLAFATGLHRSTKEFKMDPVTLQIRTRLFWALYILDTALAYSQGRPPLIRLSECSVDLPIIVDNEYIKKTEILPQPEDDPPVAMAAAVKMIEIYMVTEQVLSAINIPARTPAAAFSLNNPLLDRSELFKRAQERLHKIERDLPPYLSQEMTPNQTPHFLHSSRVRTTLQFVRTLIARQALIDELETGPTPSKEETSFATSEACHLSVDTVKIYSHLRHLGFLRFCGFDAVSHVTAAAHTLIACMFRSSSLAFEYRPDLLTAIDVLLIFSSPFPYVETVAQQLVQLSRTLDYKHGSNTQSEAVAIRILARRMARSSSNIESTLSTQFGKGDSTQRFDVEPLFGHVGAGPSNTSSNYHQSTTLDTPFRAAHSEDMPTSITNHDASSWPSLQSTESVESQWMYTASGDAVWEDSFSFLNDGLFSKL